MNCIFTLFNNTVLKGKNKVERICVHVLLSFFFVGYFLIPFWNHLNLRTALFDFGLQEQVIWNTSEGRWFESSPEVDNFLGDHFSPLLLLVALIYRLFPCSLTLFIIQSGSATLAVWALYRISQVHLASSKLRILFLAILVLYRPLAGMLLFDFHEIALAFPFLCVGLYFLEKKQMWIGTLLLVTAMLAKEEVGVLVSMIGMYFFVIRKQKFGIFLFIYGALYSLFSIFFLIPYFRNGMPSDSLERYSYLGTEPLMLYKEIIHRPTLLMREIISREKIVYFFKLFSVVPPLILVFPEVLFLVLPAFFINFLSNSSAQVSTNAQYDVLTTVAIFYSLIFALKKISQEQLNKRYLSKSSTYIGLIFVAVLVNVLIIHKHPLWSHIFIENRREDRKALIEITQNIPKEATLYVSNNLGAHLAKYENIYLFDPPWLPQIHKPEYIVIDTKEYSGYYDFESTPEYKLIEKKGNILLYGR